MSQTYSTRQRDGGSGQMYSNPRGRANLVQARPGSGGTVPLQSAPVSQETAAPSAPQAVPTLARFTLTGQGLPVAAQVAPQGSGIAAIMAPPGLPLQVTAALSGVLPPSDSAVRPALWLIHDLTVPQDLAPADLAALPKGAAGTGNQPGSLFTVDGNPPTYLVSPNTISVAISPGDFTPVPGGFWQFSGALDDAANRAFHPMAVLGPAVLADINASLPTGTVARILTDLLMRPATVHRELNLQTQFSGRLAAVAQEVLATAPPAYLDPACFTRAAVTLEGLVRGTPRLLPTRESCFLIALSRDAI